MAFNYSDITGGSWPSPQENPEFSSPFQGEEKPQRTSPSVEGASAIASDMQWGAPEGAPPIRNNPEYVGRPGGRGSHMDNPSIRRVAPAPPAFSREASLRQLADTPDWDIRYNPDFNGLKDDALGSTVSWATEVRKRGLTPVLTSAHRTTQTSGTGHRGGVAIDVGILNRDGSLLSEEDEYRITREAATKAGFKYSLNEISRKTKNWTGPHIHLSMDPEGEALSYEPKKRVGVRESLQAPKSKIRQSARTIASSVGVNPDVFEALVEAESGFQVHGRDGKIITSHVGAQGLTQMMPDTMREMGKKYGFTPEEFANRPTVQLRAGALYLKEMLDATGDYGSAISAYNAGLGGLKNMRQAGAPYGETLGYYRKIVSSYTGKDVSLEQAKKDVLRGSDHVAGTLQAGFVTDEILTPVSEVLGFAGNYASSVAKYGLGDTGHGALELLQGVTLGLSTFVPFLDPGDRWDGLRAMEADGSRDWWDTNKSFMDNASQSLIELPWFLGTVFTGEMLAVGAAAKFGSSKLAATSTTNWGRTMLEGMTARQAAKGGALGPLSKLMFSKPVSFMDNVLAHTAAFGTQAATEGTSHRIHAGDTDIGSLVVGATTDFMIGAAGGMLLSVGLPVAGSLATHLGGGNLQVLKGMTPGLEEGAGAVAKGAAQRAGIAGFEGGVLGAGYAGATGKDPYEGFKSGVVAGVGIAGAGPVGAQAILKKASPQTRKLFEAGAKKFWDGLDNAQKGLYSNAVLDRIGLFRQEKNAAVAEAHLASEVVNVKGRQEAITRTRRNLSEAKQKIDARHTKAKDAMDASDRSLESLSPDQKRAWENVENTHSAYDLALEDMTNLKKSYAESKSETQMMDPLKEIQLKSADNQLKSARKNRDFVAKQEESLPMSAIYERRKVLKASLEEITSSPDFEMAHSTIPDVLLGIEQLGVDAEKYLHSLESSVSPGPVDRASLRDMSPWENIGTDDTMSLLDPRDKEMAIGFMSDRAFEYAERMKSSPSDPALLKALERGKIQSFIDPYGKAEKDFVSTRASIDEHISNTKKMLRSVSRGKTARTVSSRSFSDKSSLNWEMEGDTKVLAIEMSALVDVWGPAPSPKASLGGAIGGEEITVPRGEDLINMDGSFSGLPPEVTEAYSLAYHSGDAAMPVSISKVPAAGIRKALKRHRKEMLSDRVRSLEAEGRRVSQGYEEYLKAPEHQSSRVASESDGSHITGSPYRINRESFFAETIREQAAVHSPYVFGDPSFEADIIPDGVRAMRSLPVADQNAIVLSKLEDYEGLFFDETPSAATRYKTLERIAEDHKGGIAVTPEEQELLNLGNDAINDFEHLYWKAMKETQTRADGRIDEAEVFGVTQEYFTELHGTQMAVQEYANKIETSLRDSIQGTVSEVLEGKNSKEELYAFLQENLGDSWESIVTAPRESVTPEGAFSSLLAFALDDNALMGKVVKAYPEVASSMGLYLKHLSSWEGVMKRSPHLKEYLTPSYLMRRFKDMGELAGAHPNDSAFVRKVSSLSTERSRSYTTTVEAKREFLDAQDVLLRRNITKDQFMRMPLDQKMRVVTLDKGDAGSVGIANAGVSEDAATVRGRPSIQPAGSRHVLFGSKNRKKVFKDVEEFTSALLVGNPETDVATLMSSKVKMVAQADSMRRMLHGLTQMEAVNPDTGKAFKLVEMGGADSARSSAIPGYHELSSLPGWDSVSMENIAGDKIPASNIYIHPDVSKYLSDFAGSSSGKISESWNIVTSLLRTSTLWGTPVPHFLNTLTNNLTEFLLTPARAVGMISAGKSLAGDGLKGMSGDYLKMYAMQAGVNTKVMRTATRMISQDVAKSLNASGVDVFGVARKESKSLQFLQSIDPMDQVKKKVAQANQGKVARAASEVIGFGPELDLKANVKMLFDNIEAAQLSGFYYRTHSYLEEMRAKDPSFAGLPRGSQLKIAQSAAAETVNRVAGAIPYHYSHDKIRKFVYSTVLTPSWFLAKARSFVGAMDSSLGLYGGGASKAVGESRIGQAVGRALPEKAQGVLRGASEFLQSGKSASSALAGNNRTSFGHLPAPARKLYAEKLVKNVAGGLAAYVAALQVSSYYINGQTTFENPDPGKWLHLRVGDHYYNSPLFGFFRDVAKSMGGTAAGEGVEPWLKSLSNQFLPLIKSTSDVVRNQDGFTGKRVLEPGAGAGKQVGQALQHVLFNTASVDELYGGRSATFADISKSFGDRPVNRLNGGEWLLRQFGVWESDYNAPTQIKRELSAVLDWHKGRLRKDVTAYIRAAKGAKDPNVSQGYLNSAYSLALVDGVEVDHDKLSPYLPEGKLKMSSKALRTAIKKVYNPHATGSLPGSPEGRAVFYNVLDAIRKEEQLEKANGYRNYMSNRKARK